MIERHPRLGFLQDVIIEPEAVELATEVMPEIVFEKLRTIGQIAIEPMSLPERIVQSRVKWARTDHRGEHGDWIGNVQSFAHGFGLSNVLVLDGPGDVDRISELRVAL